MRTRSSEMFFNIGETVEKENLCRKTHQLAQVYKGVQTNIKVFNYELPFYLFICIILFVLLYILTCLSMWSVHVVKILKMWLQIN